MSRKRSSQTAFTQNVFGPQILLANPPQVKVEDQSPVAKVLNNKKTLFKIFGFLDIKMQSKCRRVCRRWRSLLTISFRASIETISRTNICVNVGASADIFNCKDGAVKFVGVKTENRSSAQAGSAGTATAVPAEMECLLIQDACILFMTPETKWRQIRRMPWFISSVLELDWLPSVRKLGLDRCMTVDDWNAASNAILAKFPGLVELQLWLPEGRNYVLPLVYADMQKKPKVPLRSLKKVRVNFNIRYVDNNMASSSSNAQRQRYGGIEREIWWSGVRWDFLVYCSRLEEFQACIAYGDPHIMGRFDFIHYNYNSVKVKAKRLFPQVSEAVEARSSWKAQVVDRFSEWSSDFSDMNPLPTGPAAVYNAVLIREIANILAVVRPTDLQLPLQAALISAIPPSAKTRVEVLGFGNVEAKPGEITFALKSLQGFPNVKKLEWTPFCCGSDSGTSLASTSSMTATTTLLTPITPNLVTVMLNDSNAWMEGNLWRMAPNVQLVITTYLVGAPGISDVFRAVRQALTFGRLKHLVLLAEEKVDFMKPPSSTTDMTVVCSELTQLKYLWLEGLESFTLIAKLPVDLLQLTRTCVDLCSSVRTIRKLGVYQLELGSSAQADQQAAVEIDASRLGIPVPGHLNIRSGSTALLGTGEAKFDGLIKSYVNWEEVCCLPRYDQRMGGFKFLF